MAQLVGPVSESKQCQKSISTPRSLEYLVCMFIRLYLFMVSLKLIFRFYVLCGYFLSWLYFKVHALISLSGFFMATFFRKMAAAQDATTYAGTWCNDLQETAPQRPPSIGLMFIPVHVTNTLLSCQPLPGNAAAETALQPPIWCFESLSSRGYSYPEEFFFTDTGRTNRLRPLQNVYIVLHTRPNKDM